MKRKLSMEHWNWNLIHEINQSMEWNNRIGMELEQTNKQIVFGKRLSSTNKPHRKKLWLLVHFYILFLKIM